MPTLLLLSRDNACYKTLIEKVNLGDLTILSAEQPDQIRSMAPQADILLGEPALIAAALPYAEKLVWAQSTYAGVDALMAPDMRRDYRLTNIRGIFGPLMSEYIFAHLLSMTRHLPIYREQQQHHHWAAHPYQPLSQRQMLILGTGSIGQHVAATARTFGMSVIGVNRSGREVAGFDETYQISALPRLLPEADVIVSILPATRETRHLLTADLLALCRSDSVLFNVGRGDLIESGVLYQALKQGHPGAAVVDVFEQEPLEPHHPLWTLPNLIITPHNAAWSLPTEVIRIFERNYLHYLQDEPLDYQINFEAGY